MSDIPSLPTFTDTKLNHTFATTDFRLGLVFSSTHGSGPIDVLITEIHVLPVDLAPRHPSLAIQLPIAQLSDYLAVVTKLSYRDDLAPLYLSHLSKETTHWLVRPR